MNYTRAANGRYVCLGATDVDFFIRPSRQSTVPWFGASPDVLTT